MPAAREQRAWCEEGRQLHRWGRLSGGGDR
jgi:hypothetical protein